ncbi:MAG: hypothetical protein DLM57_15570 [Pseudonocardiales bacterium]|nr:MAG: hypothetical protein DLM57_15570 [Pseudonocardiales bacterium]
MADLVRVAMHPPDHRSRQTTSLVGHERRIRTARLDGRPAVDLRVICMIDTPSAWLWAGCQDVDQATQ